MVKLNKIYTRTGDAGDSGLVDGSRRPKYDLCFEVVGAVDEANSAIGLARVHTANLAKDHKYAPYDSMLERIEHDLFDLGADISTPHSSSSENALRIIASQITWMEQEMDRLNERISPLNSFVLPGGCELAARLHLSRTIVRRAERASFILAEQESINPEALKYLNRLSDFLFVLARAVNNNGEDDILWRPGVNR